MKRNAYLVPICLVVGVILACSLSQAELDAQATQIAANIFATLTAEAPTPTNTPTSTNTPTFTPTPPVNPFPSTSTPVLDLPPTPTPPPLLPTYTSTPTPPSFSFFSSATLGFSLDYPETWQKKEETLQVVFSPSADGLDPHNLKDASIWIGKAVDNDSTIADMLADALAGFPPEAETLREGTIRIASQTWTSVQIRFDDEDLGGQGVATLIVTNIDGKGYFLVAVAPAERWNSFQPFFQEMINSFRFSSEVIGQATSQPVPSLSGVYQQALEAASANTKVVQALGTPIEGDVLHGMVDTTGALGEADIALSISGPENSGTLYAVATKRMGREIWNFTLLEVVVDGQGEPIDLLEGGPVADESQQAADIHYERGFNYFHSGHYEQAMAEYTKAIELDPEFAAAYNGLCWTGSLSGQATEVMEACERGVELAPDNGAYRDSRGLARALTGDYAGAIEDFRFFVTWSKGSGPYEPLAPKREAWIAELEAQRNPFDEATLEELQNE